MFIFHRRLHEQEGLSRPLKFIKGKTTETDSQRRLVCPHSHDSIYVNPGFTDEVRFIIYVLSQRHIVVVIPSTGKFGLFSQVKIGILVLFPKLKILLLAETKTKNMKPMEVGRVDRRETCYSFIFIPVPFYLPSKLSTCLLFNIFK